MVTNRATTGAGIRNLRRSCSATRSTNCRSFRKFWTIQLSLLTQLHGDSVEFTINTRVLCGAQETPAGSRSYGSLTAPL
jgi:hypothetical protein